MTSYRDGKPTGLTLTRLAGDTLLGSRYAAAEFARCSPVTIWRRCQPVACDVGTRAHLYDLDEATRHAHSSRRNLTTVKPEIIL